MSFNSKILISSRGLSKTYEIYDKPIDRLKQIILGRPDRCFYREFHALCDVSFEVERGTSLGIIGRNGAGKSTLLQLITGTLEPSSGNVTVNGKVAAVLELGAGFNQDFSGRENIELYCNLLQMPADQIRSRFDEIVDFSELRNFIDQPLKTYSSGMIARLAFSVIAHIDADILIVDEALSVGDAAFSQKCMRFFREFKKRGTIFFVSHDLSAVKAFCDKAIWLDGGKIRSYGEANRVCEDYLADIYPSSNTISDEIELSVNIQEDLENQQMSDSESSALEMNEIFDDSLFSSEISSEKFFDGAQKIESFHFNENTSSFGSGGAIISTVLLRDRRGRDLAFCDAQQQVVLTVEVKFSKYVSLPIVGFFIKDRLGQPLFGANTYLTYKNRVVDIKPGQHMRASFVFKMPTLLVGDYSISAAIAEGTLEAHTQLYWAHDAAFFKISASTLDGVLVGIPMERIVLSVIEE